VKIVAAFVLFAGLTAAAASAQSRPAPVVHHQVSDVAAAQTAFDQGLLDYYAYNPEAAEHEFYMASDLDPHLAMAYWGIAISNAPNLNVPANDDRDQLARYAIERAKDLERYATPEDRALIDAAAARYDGSAKTKPSALQRAYSNALGRIAKRYSGDAVAAGLYAEADLYATDDEADNGNHRHATAALLPLFQGYLKKFPNDISLLHFYIHAAQMAGESALARDAAVKLASFEFEPQDSHLTHMPGHIFLDLGMYPQGVDVASRSVAMDEAEIACCHPGFYSATRYYRRHNVSFLLYALTEDEKAADAISAAKRYGDLDFLARQYVAAKQWRNAVAVASPPHPPTGFSFARGVAFAELGDATQASRELALVPMPSSTASPDDATRAAMHLTLAARIDELQHRNVRALAALQRASTLANGAFKSSGDEMPELYYYSPNLQLASLARQLGRVDVARKALHAELSVTPKSPAALAMLARLGTKP
jgi:hypothetical protein